MSPIVRFAVSRTLFIVLTLFVITATLYGILMLAPAEVRASLWIPPRTPPNQTEEQARRFIETIIKEHHLDAPYPVQYSYWIAGLARGDWGWSPNLRASVLDALLARAPATAELALFSVLVLVPLGLLSGVLAGWRQGRTIDSTFRAAAFAATSIPPFVLGMVLLSVFYVGLKWFAPGRTGISDVVRVTSTSFHRITGLLTLDGLLNGRLDITLDALQHLVLPAVTLGLAHWATLGRITRASMIDEIGKDYVTAARARGVAADRVLWRHALRNAIGPGLTSIALSAASLLTGVYVVEVIFDLPGLSVLMAGSVVGAAPDAATAMGFAIFSVLLVLPVMLALDVIQFLVDPRLRWAGPAV